MKHAPVLPAEGLRIQRERALDRLVARVALLGDWQPRDLAEATRAQLLARWDSMAITDDDIDALVESWKERGGASHPYLCPELDKVDSVSPTLDSQPLPTLAKEKPATLDAALAQLLEQKWL